MWWQEMRSVRKSILTCLWKFEFETTQISNDTEKQRPIEIHSLLNIYDSLFLLFSMEVELLSE